MEDRKKPKKKVTYEMVVELEEIWEEMCSGLSRAKSLIRNTKYAPRAEAYFLAHLSTALKNDHGYLGGSMCTFETTLDEMREDLEEKEEEAEE